MTICSRCQKQIGLLEQVTFNRQFKRCRSCEREVSSIKQNFRQQYIKAWDDGVLTDAEWNSIKTFLDNNRIDREEALNFIRPDALYFIERTITFAYSDGIISEEEENYVKRLISRFKIQPVNAEPLIQRLLYLKQLGDIRQGNLPSVQPSVHLEAGDICYLETEAVYHKPLARTTQVEKGRLIATKNKLYFSAPTGGNEMSWSKLLKVSVVGSGGVSLEFSVKKGNGFYLVPDPMLWEVVLETVVKINKRQLVVETSTRRIPQNVKTAVWQRDNGRCVQCSANDYLEFDHVIPYSKGGANTLGNVQLLCRRCNQAKSDRI